MMSNQSHNRPFIMVKRFLGFFVLVAIATTTFAQSVAFDMKVADVTLLTVSEIKKELAVTEAQRAQMNKYAKPYNDLNSKMRAKYEGGKGTGPTKAELSQLQKAQEGMRDKVLSVLTPTQLKRLREITLQDAGLVGLMEPNVSKEVGLSTAQVKKIESLFKSGVEKSAKLMSSVESKVQKEFKDKKPKSDSEAQKLREAFGKRMDAEIKRISPQLEKIKSDTEKSVMAQMSAAQRTKYQTMLGKPFRPK